MERLYPPFFRAPEARGLPGQGLGLRHHASGSSTRTAERIRIRSATGVGTTATVGPLRGPARTEPGATPARASSAARRLRVRPR